MPTVKRSKYHHGDLRKTLIDVSVDVIDKQGIDAVAWHYWRAFPRVRPTITLPTVASYLQPSLKKASSHLNLPWSKRELQQ